MIATVKPGLLIGALCAAWMFIMGFAGWYTHPALQNLFWLVIVLQIAVLVGALRATAKERSYGGQVAAGTLMSVVAAVFLFGASFLFTTVVFPHYFEELRAAHEAQLVASGAASAEIQRELAAAAAAQTPLKQAIAGAMGTIVTGLFASLVIAIFARKRAAQAPQATK